jgi:uncharacterized protein YodC (DUF2158 family)
MADEFTVGDVVELRSGGQDMTVVEVDQDGIVCQWFSRSGSLRRDKFQSTCIQKTVGSLINLNILNQ